MGAISSAPADPCSSAGGRLHWVRVTTGLIRLGEHRVGGAFLLLAYFDAAHPRAVEADSDDAPADVVDGWKLAGRVPRSEVLVGRRMPKRGERFDPRACELPSINYVRGRIITV